MSLLLGPTFLVLRILVVRVVNMTDFCGRAWLAQGSVNKTLGRRDLAPLGVRGEPCVQFNLDVWPTFAVYGRLI